MKHTISTIAALLIAGSVQAQAGSDAAVYQGFAAGNSDLRSDPFSSSGQRLAARDAEVYHGFEVMNSELSTDIGSPGSSVTAMVPQIGSSTSDYHGGSELFRHRSIYNGFEMGNPDL